MASYGRGDLAEAAPGTTVTGLVVDNGDGSYTVPATWDPGVVALTGRGDRPARPAAGRGGSAAGPGGLPALEDAGLVLLVLILLLVLVFR